MLEQALAVHGQRQISARPSWSECSLSADSHRVTCIHHSILRVARFQTVHCCERQAKPPLATSTILPPSHKERAGPTCHQNISVHESCSKVQQCICICSRLMHMGNFHPPRWNCHVSPPKARPPQHYSRKTNPSVDHIRRKKQTWPCEVGSDTCGCAFEPIKSTYTPTRTHAETNKGTSSAQSNGTQPGHPHERLGIWATGST